MTSKILSPLLRGLLPLLAVMFLTACGGGGGGGGNAGGGSAPVVGEAGARTTIRQWETTFKPDGTPTETTAEPGETAEPLDGTGYTVGVVDSGFRHHANLEGRGSLGKRSLETYQDGDRPHKPKTSHGTSVSGVIGAQDRGDTFPVGVAPGASLVMVYPIRKGDPDNAGAIVSDSSFFNLADGAQTARNLARAWNEGVFSSVGEKNTKFKKFVDDNIGNKDKEGTERELQLTLRGVFFEIEEKTPGSGVYRFKDELKSRFRVGGAFAKPLVAINYSYLMLHRNSARAYLMQRAAAKFCYDNYAAFEALVDTSLFHKDLNKRIVQICGNWEKGPYHMPDTIYATAMIRGSQSQAVYKDFYDYMNAIVDTLDTDLMDNSALFQAYRDFVYDLGKEGVVSVMALGNDGAWVKYERVSGVLEIAPARFSGSYPTAFADKTITPFGAGDTRNAELRTFVLTVGALGGPPADDFSKVANNEWLRASYSNACGAESKERCLFVPLNIFDRVTGQYQGIPLLYADPDQPTVGVSPNARGTSFAAPVVTASVALVVQRFAPTMDGYTGVEAAQRLLDTTYGLGTCAGLRGEACRDALPNAAKLDDTFGHGLLDLKLALTVYTRPSNSPPQTVALGAGLWGAVERATHRGSGLSFGGVFGDVGRRVRLALAGAIIMDDLNHAHRGILSGLVGSGVRTRTDELLLTESPTKHFSLHNHTGRKGALRLSYSEETTADISYIHGTAARRLFASGQPMESLTNLVADAPAFSLSYSPSANNRTADSTADSTKTRYWLSYSDSAFTGDKRDQLDNSTERGGQRLLRFGAVHTLSGNQRAGARAHLGTRVRWATALLDENSETLGGVNRGVYGFEHGAETRAFSLGIDHGLSPALSLATDITTARTEAGQGGLITKWDSVRSVGWSFSVRHESPDSKTQSGVRFSQPLRANDGAIHFSYPVRYHLADKRISHEQRSIGLRPSGRELRLELSTSHAPEPWLDIEGRFLYRHEPNHDRTADDEYGFGLGVRIHF